MKKFIYLFLCLFLLTLSACNNKNKYSIQLEKESLTLYVTESYEIKPTINHGKKIVDMDVTITSNNEEIVSVEGNIITAKAKGAAVITVALKDHPDIKSTITVTVVNNLKVSSPKTSLFVGEQVKLVIEDKADTEGLGVQFEINNPSVIKVDNNGVVTALSKGEAILTIRSKSTNLSEVITFTVNIVAITDVEIENIPASINVFDEFQLIAKVRPANATKVLLGKVVILKLLQLINLVM